MASFILNTTSTTLRTLLAGEDAIIGQNGALLILSGDAITGTGSNNIFVAGSIVTTSGSGIDLTSVTSSEIMISSSGSVLSSGDAISMTMDSASGNRGEVTNAGTIESGSDGVDMRGFDAGTILKFTNTGTVTGISDGLVIGQAGSIEVINTGTITGFDSAIATDVGSNNVIRIVNTGTLIGGDGRALSSGSTSQTTLVNSGHIEGFLDFSEVADTYQGRDGTINGDIFGRGGDDTLKAGAGDEYIDGGSGLDVIEGRGGDDTIFGGDDADELRGGRGADDVNGGEGKDTIFGGRDDDLLSGDDGSDTLNGGQGDDTLNGGTGNDVLMGDNGHDELDGGSKNDTLSGGRGDDTLTGGSGTDVFVFNASGGFDVVTDYVDGTDRIDLSSLDLNNFAQLSSAGAFTDFAAGVIIDLGVLGIDTMIQLIGTQTSDLNGADFIF